MSQQTFRKWKPGVWAALSNGLYTLEDESQAEEALVDNQDPSLDAVVSFLNMFMAHSISTTPSSQESVRGGALLLNRYNCGFLKLHNYDCSSDLLTRSKY